MEYTVDEKNRIIETNKQEFGSNYFKMKWLNYYKCLEAIEERDNLLKEIIELGAKSGYNETKFDVTNISQGCKYCAEGIWSCLFINNICNASCYYCPTAQKTEGIPGTNSLDFSSPSKYAEYVKRFNFKGVSLSGGEPFLTFDKTLQYIEEIRKQSGGSVYIWLYTNGKLATKEKLSALKNAGINEIRFDIGAAEYSLDKVSLAPGIIDNVTIEIPSAPSNYKILESKLREIKNIGVNFLNLHQLRATPYNVEKLIDKGYTFIHGPKVTVFESELNALRLVEYSIKSGINLPVNYCSSIYKSLFQLTGSRRRHSKEVMEFCEEITKSGYLRKVFNGKTAVTFNMLNEELINDDNCYIMYFNSFIAKDPADEKGYKISKFQASEKIALTQSNFKVIKSIINGEIKLKDQLTDDELKVYNMEMLPDGLTEYF